ncbi:MAG: KEOPS complex subunit Pcc1 [Candidatus Bathyarchaeia archaeon]|nr:KEOPS complex subunit Pcc1 [Candidatus Bathyarchaeia archaeon]
MKAKTTIRLLFSSEKQLRTLLDALDPEANRLVTMRAKTILEKEGRFLILKVEAKDTIALRAALNAYLRWIDSTVKVLQIIERTM